MSNLAVVTEGLRTCDGEWPCGVVLVTGPQRSGTRIGAKILAAELGYEYVDEQEFDVDDVSAFYARVVARSPGCVVQCPGLSFIVDRLPVELETLAGHHLATAVVWMVRDLDAIARSEKRIGWTHDDHEALKYSDRPEVREHYRHDTPSRVIKTEAWKQTQRAVLGTAAFELHYDSLSEHSLWVPPEQRHNFAPLQTEVVERESS